MDNYHRYLCSTERCSFAKHVKLIECSLGPRRKKFYDPPDPQLLQEARERRLTELKMYDILREVGLYLVYVTVAMIISYDCQDPRGYLIRQNMKSSFIDGGRGLNATSSNSLLLVKRFSKSRIPFFI